MRKPKDVIINGITLDKILTEHEKWLDIGGGTQADLSYTDLREVDLSGKDLRGINLNGTCFHYADLTCAKLKFADLRDADLRFSKLRGADFASASLAGAYLSNASNTETCKYNETTSFFALQCPEEGSFIGWKVCKYGLIVKLEIPKEARRSSATSRKCRAEFVKVLEIQDSDGHRFDYFAYSTFDRTVYKEGITVHADKWDSDRWNECSNGIHFFITRQEAVNYM